jgi:hypothetical protein
MATRLLVIRATTVTLDTPDILGVPLTVLTDRLNPPGRPLAE